MLTEQNKAIVRRFFEEVCNEGNHQIIEEIFDSNVRFNGKPGSYSDVIQYLEEIKMSFEKPHVEVNKQLAEEDWVSTMRTWTGVQKDKYKYLGTDRQMTWKEISMVRLANGKIVEDWIMRDELMPASETDGYKLNPNDYIELWKFFQNRADEIKGRLWTSIIWHYTILAGLMLFVFEQFMKFNIQKIHNPIFYITYPLPCAIFSCLGILFCVNALRFISEYGVHISSNWDRADILKHKIIGLQKIVNLHMETSDEKQYEQSCHKPELKGKGFYIILNWFFKWENQTNDTKYMIWLTLVFVLIFLCLFVSCLIRPFI